MWVVADDRGRAARPWRSPRAAPGVGAPRDGAGRRDRGAAGSGRGGRAGAEDRRERAARGVRPRLRAVRLVFILLRSETKTGERHSSHARKPRFSSNHTIFRDLEWLLIQISRSRYYSTLNNSKIIQDRAITTIRLLIKVHGSRTSVTKKFKKNVEYIKKLMLS